MTYLPIPVHPWVYHVFIERKSCYEHCASFTFSERFGWRPAWARLVAFFIAPTFARLNRSAGGIAVYRNSLKLRKTFVNSIAALKRGESLLIFPDVDYTSSTGDTGRLYDGFLMLDRLYAREKGEHIKFVPLHISNSQRSVNIGEPICFEGRQPYEVERDRVVRSLRDELNRLSKLYGE